LTTGRTEQNKLVHFAPPGDRRLAVGSFATVEVTGAAPHHLVGELVEVTGRPRHRTRIPVAAG
jgi:tRNA A37 methylthiotransferase MiaB